MQPPIFAKYSSARALIHPPEKHNTDIFHFKLLKKWIKLKLKQTHISIILVLYFPSFVIIYIILLPLFLGYDMSCVCRLSARNACTVATFSLSLSHNTRCILLFEQKLLVLDGWLDDGWSLHATAGTAKARLWRSEGMLLASTVWSGVEPQLESNIVHYSLIEYDLMAIISTKFSST